MIDDIFAAAGRRREDYVSIVPVDPFYRIEFHDGRWFEYNGDEQETARKIAAFSPGDETGYLEMIRRTRAIFEKGFVELSDRPFLRFTDMLRVAPDLVRLQSYRTVWSFVSQYVKDPLLRRVLSFHPLLVGGNPFQTTSIYALIHHLEKEWGVHYAMGGTGALVQGLGRLFQELGGRVHLNTPVRRIATQNRRAVGIETAQGERVTADAVVSNADVATTYTRLLDPADRSKYTDAKLRKMRYSMSLFVIYFGTSRQYPDVRHHTILLGERYQELLEDIFTRKRLTDDFSIYLHRPSLTDPQMAPAGCDCYYALVPVPNQLSGVDWNREAKPFRDHVMRYLDRYLPGVENHIVTERWFTPLDFETVLQSYAGSAFSFEPVLTQSAWFRPHNASEDIANLYFAGAGTHPGAGLPGVMSSAKIVEKLMCVQVPL
jgi:phytoene desaturase